MTAVFAKSHRSNTSLLKMFTGEDKEETGAIPLKLEFVDKIYLSIAPKEDKYRYVKLDQLQGFFTPDFYTSKLSKKYMTVYVVEFYNDHEPIVLPTVKYTFNAIVK